jgi:cadmium resistance protein CadD (predicted permease)
LRFSSWEVKTLEDWSKIKISVLWLFYTVAFLAVMTLGTMEPGVLSQFLDTGEIGGMKIGQELLLFFAVMILVPLVMAFLSLTLKNSTNRWANVIVGIVYIGFQLFALVETLTLQTVYAYAVLMETTKVIVPALIVWYAWKSKQKS